MATSLRHHRDANEEVDFRGEKRSNQTHASTTDPDARLYRKGRSGMEAKLSFIGHALMENRNGLFVAARLTNVSGHAERLAALDMIEPYADRATPITLGGDKGFDAADFTGHGASRNQRNDPPVRHRPAHDASSGLRHQPACSKTDRRGLRMDEDNRRNAETQIPKPRKGRLVIVHPAAAAYNLIRLPKLMAQRA